MSLAYFSFQFKYCKFGETRVFSLHFILRVKKKKNKNEIISTSLYIYGATVRATRQPLSFFPTAKITSTLAMAVAARAVDGLYVMFSTYLLFDASM